MRVCFENLTIIVFSAKNAGLKAFIFNTLGLEMYVRISFHLALLIY